MGYSLALGWAMRAGVGRTRVSQRREWVAGQVPRGDLTVGGRVPSVLHFTDRQQKPSTLRRSPMACSRVVPSRVALKEGSVAW